MNRLEGTPTAPRARPAHKKKLWQLGFVAPVLLIGGVAQATAQGSVNIYSYRQPNLMAPLLEAFTKKTGIKTNVVFAEAGLPERMAAEGKNSPADVFLTVDISRLAEAKQMGITQPVESATLKANVPAQFRDPDGHWFAHSIRGRVIYASRDRVKQEHITYEELADPKWKGKICTRSGQHVYNVGLIASMIAHHGLDKAREWLKGVKGNLARKPGGNDRSQVRGVFSGECDLAIGNTYYMAAMQLNKKNPEQQKWAASVRMMFPNFEGRGTHVNISGAMLAKYAPNKANGIKLIEFLSSDEGQKIYAEIVNEYPLKPGIAISKLVAGWGKLKPDSLSLEKVAKNRADASKLVDEVGFNSGP
ncbi:MAG: hypothetical protein RLZ98_1742 [Pseudomonadota bacterium]|jgi:iron(III) transport system substrate-binding protein